ncbi:phosphotransferase family protein [Acrocarpospora catenulata]|uniref:phosphotransferase family protein n=1 Tax=Acrocarpospora catenulata TaxID=2836182 RepID=UPI001BDA5713|nr:phosphotransferase family protein [Acrocarpospora catenulata]
MGDPDTGSQQSACRFDIQEIGGYLADLLSMEKAPNEVTQFGGGWSDVTIRAAWDEVAVAARFQRSAGLFRNNVLDLEGQGEVLRILAERQIPSPRVRTFARTTPIAGMPVLVTDWLSGYSPVVWSPEGQAFYAAVGDGRGGEDFVDVLAAIHAINESHLDPESHLARTMASRTTAQELSEFRRIIESGAGGAHEPLFRDALRWLESNVPVETEDGRSLVHGDYQPGNLIVDKSSGRILAVLDWEMARLADYHYDLGWIASRFNRVGSDRFAFIVRPEMFFESYERRSGRVIDMARLEYWKSFQHLRHIMMFLSTRDSGETSGMTADIRLTRGLSNISNLAVMLAEQFGY